MEWRQYSTMVDATKGLKERGFTHEFKLREDGMECLETGVKYQPDDMKIVEYHRFEGMSNPADMSAVFAIECNDETQGLVVSSYGPYADIELIDFLDKVKIEESEGSR